MSRSTARSAKGSRSAKRTRKPKRITARELRKAPYFTDRDQKLLQQFLGACKAEVAVTLHQLHEHRKRLEQTGQYAPNVLYWKHCHSLIDWLCWRSSIRQAHLLRLPLEGYGKLKA